MNLNTSNGELFAFFEKAFGENGTPAMQQYLTMLMQMRTQMISMISNFIKMIHDGASAVIGNIRA